MSQPTRNQQTRTIPPTHQPPNQPRSINQPKIQPSNHQTKHRANQCYPTLIFKPTSTSIDLNLRVDPHQPKSTTLWYPWQWKTHHRNCRFPSGFPLKLDNPLLGEFTKGYSSNQSTNHRTKFNQRNNQPTMQTTTAHRWKDGSPQYCASGGSSRPLREDPLAYDGCGGFQRCASSHPRKKHRLSLWDSLSPAFRVDPYSIAFNGGKVSGTHNPKRANAKQWENNSLG